MTGQTSQASDWLSLTLVFTVGARGVRVHGIVF